MTSAYNGTIVGFGSGDSISIYGPAYANTIKNVTYGGLFTNFQATITYTNNTTSTLQFSVNTYLSISVSGGYATIYGAADPSPPAQPYYSLQGLDGNGNANAQQQLSVFSTTGGSQEVFTFSEVVGGQAVILQQGSNTTYTPTAADAGQLINVSVSYYDTHGVYQTQTLSAAVNSLPPTVTAPGPLTNNAKPTISGTGEIGATINLTIDGSVVDTSGHPVIVKNDGTWTYTPGSLTDGSHKVTATQTGAADTSDPSATDYFTIDTKAPVIQSVSLDSPTYGLGSTVTAKIQLTTPWDGNGNYTLGSGSTIDGMALTGGSFVQVNDYLMASFVVTGTTAQVTNGSLPTHITVNDTAGNTSAVYNTAITGETIDTIAPLLASATVNGNQLVLTFAENGSGLNAADEPIAEEFIVQKDASPDSISNITLNATNKTVTLTLQNAIAGSDTVTVSYSPLGSSPENIQDNAGNLAASFSNQPVTNTTPAAGTIAGTVFNDLNGNGVRDNGDPALPGVAVNISKGDVVVAALVIGNSGNYSISGLSPGPYTVSFLTGDVPTTPTMVQDVMVSAGSTSTVDAGFYVPSTVSGTVFYDHNDNGLKDPGEGGIQGVELQLISSAGTELADTTSNLDGTYSFTNVAPGADTVVARKSTVPDGYVATETLPIPVTVTSGSSSTDNIGFYVPPTISITTPIAGDNVINAAEAAAGVTIFGTSSVGPGQMVTVDFSSASNKYAGDFEIPTMADGSWSVALSPSYAKGLSDTAYTVTADVSDQFGNFAPPASQPFTVDETPPTVSSLTEVTSTGTSDLEAGTSVTFTLTGSETLAVDPAATLTLNNGGTAIYAGGSGTIAATFTYSVASRQDTPDLMVAGYTGSITDLAGNPLNVADVTKHTGIQIDTTPPTVSSLTEVTSTGTSDLKAGTSVTFTLTGSEALTVAPAATLTLNDGGTATYTSGSGTTAPTFTYIVVSGGDTPDLKVVGYTGSITDAAGNPLVASGVTKDTGVQIDTIAPAQPAAPTLAPASDSGVKGDGITNVTMPIVTGSAEANALVTLYDTDGTVLGTQQLTGGATIYALAAPLPNGKHALTVTATDLAGNTSPSSSALSVTVDTAAPTVSSPTLTVAAGSGATPIRITASDDFTAAGNLTAMVGTLPGDGTVTLADGTTAVAAGESLTAAQLTSLAFTPGSSSAGQSPAFTYSVTDEAGNQTAGRATLNVYGDPTITGLQPSTTTRQAPTQPFASAMVSDPTTGATDTITITPSLGTGTLSGTGLTANPDGTYTLASASPSTLSSELDALIFMPSPDDGGPVETTSFSLTVTNSSGASSSASVTSTIDSTSNMDLFGSMTHDVTSPAGEIYALYESILGRAPDAVGFETQVAAVGAGASLTTIAQSLLDSPEYAADCGASVSSNGGFVTQLYQDGLHRTPDPGAQGFIDGLNAGTQSRAQVAAEIATSQESQTDLAPTFANGVFVPDASDAAVARLYYGLLNRAPDAAGLQAEETAIDSGTSTLQLIQSVLGSAEYQGTTVGQDNFDYIQNLYKTALGRQGDAAGLQPYETGLDTGSLSRAQVADDFLTSTEFQSDEAGQSNASYVNAVYEAALGRQADPDGSTYWQTQLANGMSRSQMAQDIVGSTEFASKYTAPGQAEFVQALYEGALGRAPAASETQAWQAQLSNGASLATVAAGIIESPEAANRLAPKIEAGYHIA